MRYSMACRPIERRGELLVAGHGGRWTNTPAESCPRCGRHMVLLGTVAVVAVAKP